MATINSEANTAFSAEFVDALAAIFQKSEVNCPFRNDLLNFIQNPDGYSSHHKGLILACANNSRTFSSWVQNFASLGTAFVNTDKNEEFQRTVNRHFDNVDALNFAEWLEESQRLYDQWGRSSTDRDDLDQGPHEESLSPTSHVNMPVNMPVPAATPIPMETEPLAPVPELLNLLTKEELLTVALTTKPSAVSAKTWLSMTTAGRKIMMTGADATSGTPPPSRLIVESVEPVGTSTVFTGHKPNSFSKNKYSDKMLPPPEKFTGALTGVSISLFLNHMHAYLSTQLEYQHPLNTSGEHCFLIIWAVMPSTWCTPGWKP